MGDPNNCIIDHHIVCHGIAFLLNLYCRESITWQCSPLYRTHGVNIHYEYTHFYKPLWCPTRKLKHWCVVAPQNAYSWTWLHFPECHVFKWNWFHHFQFHWIHRFIISTHILDVRFSYVRWTVVDLLDTKYVSTWRLLTWPYILKLCGSPFNVEVSAIVENFK
jgi:hypothetical protein